MVVWDSGSGPNQLQDIHGSESAVAMMRLQKYGGNVWQPVGPRTTVSIVHGDVIRTSHGPDYWSCDVEIGPDDRVLKAKLVEHLSDPPFAQDITF